MSDSEKSNALVTYHAIIQLPYDEYEYYEEYFKIFYTVELSKEEINKMADKISKCRCKEKFGNDVVIFEFKIDGIDIEEK